MADPTSCGIECRFFIGGTTMLPEEPDTTVLPVDDSYQMLPAKVLAFFAHALKTSDFEWLFKCDDDTYLVLDRLHGIIPAQGEIVGNKSLADRGSPSGGAGYLLSRRVVAAIVEDPTLPMEGAEDIIIGEAAVKHGAAPVVDNNLRGNAIPYPNPDNNLVTAHWCSPDRLHAIEARMTGEPFKSYRVNHNEWSDDLHFHRNGTFYRCNSGCNGTWEMKLEGEQILHLKWFDWECERVTACPGGFVGTRMVLFDSDVKVPRTLLFSSVGENERAFTSWLAGPADVAVVYHGDQPDGEFASILAKRVDYFGTHKGGKFPNLLWLIDNHPDILEQYDRFVITDDDILLPSTQLELLLREASAWDLPVCSPAHDPRGKISWPHMAKANKNQKRIQHCNFVEMTCVVFDQEALRKFIQAFRPHVESLVGWGADFIISSACFDESRPFGVVHSVQVKNPSRRSGTGIENLLARHQRAAQWNRISGQFPLHHRNHVRIFEHRPPAFRCALDSLNRSTEEDPALVSSRT